MNTVPGFFIASGAGSVPCFDFVEESKVPISRFPSRKCFFLRPTIRLYSLFTVSNVHVHRWVCTFGRINGLCSELLLRLACYIHLAYNDHKYYNPREAGFLSRNLYPEIFIPKSLSRNLHPEIFIPKSLSRILYPEIFIP